MLTAIKYVQNIGRFEKAVPTDQANFGRCTLVFGENGWGKSTLADILRSLSTNNPAILVGRTTLASTTPPKAVLQVNTQPVVFEDGNWSGPRPAIEIYDSIFVNENIFSGDIVTSDHLKKQYGLVIGETGVALARRIVALDEENRELNQTIKQVEGEISATIRQVAPPTMKQRDFLLLKQQINVDDDILQTETKIQRAQRTDEIKAATEPRTLPVPIAAEALRQLLASTVEDVAIEALSAVRQHIERHAHQRR